jgi:hypothetical protein
MAMAMATLRLSLQTRFLNSACPQNEGDVDVMIGIRWSFEQSFLQCRTFGRETTRVVVWEKFHADTTVTWIAILDCRNVLHLVGNDWLITHWNSRMQGLTRWLAGQYASYDEFGFWRREGRRDHSKLLE